MLEADTQQTEAKPGLSALEFALAGCVISICLFGAVDLIATFGGW